MSGVLPKCDQLKIPFAGSIDDAMHHIVLLQYEEEGSESSIVCIRKYYTRP